MYKIPHAVRRGALLVLLLSAGACPGPIEPDVVFQVIEETEFAPALGIDLVNMTKLPSGVYIQDVEVGDGVGQVGLNNHVRVRYLGWLSNGYQFDQRELEFDTGQNQLIPGFEDGIQGMVPGGLRLMIIPPEQGYGSVQQEVIPGGSILVFFVELVAIES